MRNHSTAPAPSSLMAPLHTRAWRGAKLIAAKIATYVACWRQAYAAAALYDELYKVSDAELERRGIARGELHRHLAERLSKDR
jgi:hypothetical protein